MITLSPIKNIPNQKHNSTNFKSTKFKTIDINNWPRNEIFNQFTKLENPFVSITSRVDISKSREITKKESIQTSHAILYFLAKTANEISEFKQRIQNGRVIEYDKIGISTTVNKPNNTFNFVVLDFYENSKKFLEKAALKITTAKNDENIVPKDWKPSDDIIYSSCTPWIDFTSFTHPTNGAKDYIPRIAWGKYVPDGHKTTMATNLQVNHVLIDGFHIGEFFNRLQENLNNPNKILF